MNRFDDDTLTRIIGPGVTGIFCQPMLSLEPISDRITLVRTSYDHMRGGGPEWDFVIHRGDGERVRLHPNQTNKKVSISMIGAPIPIAADGPQALSGLAVPVTNSVATASSADTRGDRAAPPRGDGADWRGWQDWRGAWSSIFRKTATASKQNHHP